VLHCMHPHKLTIQAAHQPACSSGCTFRACLPGCGGAHATVEALLAPLRRKVDLQQAAWHDERPDPACLPALTVPVLTLPLQTLPVLTLPALTLPVLTLPACLPSAGGALLPGHSQPGAVLDQHDKDRQPGGWQVQVARRH
jgi:hypothetical protein